jgi:hypothetical protein
MPDDKMEFAIEFVRVRESDGAYAVLDRVQYFSDDYQKVIPRAKYLFLIADLVQKPDGLRILDDRGYELLFWTPGSDER